MRTFVAIDLLPDMKRAVAKARDRLIEQCPASSIRWTAPEHWHLTLAFLGEVTEARVTDVSTALDAFATECRPFDLIVRGFGVFPPRGPARVIWLGIEDPDGGLADCHDRCEARLEPLGFPREDRAFSPHLTLARIKDARCGHTVRDIIERSAPVDLGLQPVRQVVLYHSTLARSGPVHTPIGTHRFARA